MSALKHWHPGRQQVINVHSIGLKYLFHNYGTRTSGDKNSNDSQRALNGLEPAKDTKDSISLKNREKEPAHPLQTPEEPTTCCMSGCANCVWLEYAEKLTEYYRDGGQNSIKEINEKIMDPSIKAYLLHEIRMRNK